jgi:fucose 4-O-acetylase-like acetyltransferase
MGGRLVRDSVMDGLKGAAILLVVIGHSLQDLPDFDSNFLFRIIYAFHMPLFMFVSGYVAFYGRDNWSWGQLRKKAALLVLPFVAWYGVSYVVNGTYMTVGLRTYVQRVLESPDWGLWFLWVLFLNFVVLAGVLQVERWLAGRFGAGFGGQLGAAVIPLAWLVLQVAPVHAYGFDLLRWQFGFFALGFLVHRHAAVWAKWRRQLAVGGSVGFAAAVPFWHRVGNPDFAGALAQALNPRHLHQLDLLLLRGYTYAVPILGIVAAWGVVSWLALYAPNFFRLFGWLGLYTLDIYVTHQYLVRFGIGTGGLQVVTGFAVGLVGSLVISFGILRRNEVMAHIFLGKPYPRRAERAAAVAPKAGSTVAPLPSSPIVTP